MFPELWGGLECTVNRVANRYSDQINRTGHHNRSGDLELIAALGIAAMRYPVLWERTELNGKLHWAWSDERLARLRELEIHPVVGLIHHGSGPPHTSLVDPDFPLKFSRFARAVAERYPWVESFTPVNEPLTTARFSGLYGHWYPHGRSRQTFALALVHQCKAIVLAMREIRAVNPEARLIQTEDLGKTFSSPALSYQARHDNERRWLTFDLLCGRVDRSHPLWNYLLSCGIAEADLYWFVEDPCPPNVIGINHYPTSDRYLDERTENYSTTSHGGNGRHAYADVEAIRVDLNGDLGLDARLSETWQRYRLPIAVTEVHIGCSADEQARWFYQAWGAARNQIARGVPVLAVTAWALLGSFDWNSLLVRNDNVYEPGVFDLQGGLPKATPLTKLLREIAVGSEPSDPSVRGLGWWQVPQRVLYRQGPRILEIDSFDRECSRSAA